MLRDRLQMGWSIAPYSWMMRLMVDWVDDPDTWRALQAAFEARQLVIFAGAGVSAAGGLPLWPRLTERLIDRMRRESSLESDAEEASSHLQAMRYVEAISIAQRTLGDKVFGDFVKAQLDDQHKDPPPLAVAIAALHKKLHGVVTTNLDRFLERAAGGEWRDLVEPTGDLVQEPGFLWKAHGTIQLRASWVFSRPAYDRVMFGDPQYRATFGALYRARKLLFVGCGLVDDDLDFTLGEVRALAGDQPPTHFAIVEDGMWKHRRQLLERAGIRLIRYPKGQHDKVIELLRALRGAPPLPVTAPPPAPTPAPVPPPAPIPPPAPAAPSAPVTPAVTTPHYTGVPQPPSPAMSSRSTMASTGTVSSTGQGPSTAKEGGPVKLFCCYHSRDKKHYENLRLHCAGLIRDNKLQARGTDDVPAGEKKRETWLNEVRAADLVVFFLSAGLMADDDLIQLVNIARRRADANQCVMIPVRLRKEGLSNSHFDGLQVLPRDGRPLSAWKDKDDAWAHIAEEISKRVEDAVQRASASSGVDAATSDFRGPGSTAAGAGELVTSAQEELSAQAEMRERVKKLLHETPAVLKTLARYFLKASDNKDVTDAPASVADRTVASLFEEGWPALDLAERLRLSYEAQGTESDREVVREVARRALPQSKEVREKLKEWKDQLRGKILVLPYATHARAETVLARLGDRPYRGQVHGSQLTSEALFPASRFRSGSALVALTSSRALIEEIAFYFATEVQFGPNRREHGAPIYQAGDPALDFTKEGALDDVIQAVNDKLRLHAVANDDDLLPMHVEVDVDGLLACLKSGNEKVLKEVSETFPMLGFVRLDKGAGRDGYFVDCLVKIFRPVRNAPV